ncbi:MAG TPA: hypothetical protein VFV94_14020 [Polyangiaceae bacterium]|nr:hypothetical protein [Polyangiaceae bacterium]
MKHSILLVGLLASAAACGERASNGDGTGAGGTSPGAGGQSAASNGGSAGGTMANGGTSGSSTNGGSTSGSAGSAGVSGTSTTGGAAPSGGTGSGGSPSAGTAGIVAGSSGSSAGTAGATGAAGAGGLMSGGGAGAGGQAGASGQAGGPMGGASGSGGVMSSCVGKAWPTADPTKAGPFQVMAEKNVGPLAGVVPDPIYGDKQQRFNVYHPSNLANTGYCHPILIWANGYRDNPEQNPPDCVVDSGANRWCGQYLPMLQHLASHGFVVVASLSTATAEGDPLPTIAGLDWIIEQSEDSTSPYYHHLDTTNIGQLGHSYGAMSTCISAAEPRYKALMPICGTKALTGVHTPMLFFCGGKDTTVACSGVNDTYKTVTTQPAFFLEEKNSDHGSWVYQGAGGVSLSAAAAWFRIHLMNDTANRKFFYGSGCTFCSDNRATVEQNSLMK